MRQKTIPSLIDQFRGAIAGAMLGYLTGLHYSSIYPPTHPLSLIGPSLDWSWLTSPNQRIGSSENVQEVLALYCTIGHKLFWTEGTRIQAKRRHQVIHASSNDHTAHSNNSSIVPILDMLRTLKHLVEGYPATMQDAPKLTLLDPITADRNPLQAIFALLPILLLYHDNMAKQQDWIASWLQYWEYPNEWLPNFSTVGLTLAQAMRDRTTEEKSKSRELQSVDGLHPSIYHSCNTFLYSSSHYEMGLLGILYRYARLEKDWATLPLVMGLNGSLWGCKVGFAGLPLIWRHTMTTYKQSLTLHTDASQGHDAGTQLMALWSGQKPSMERKYPTTMIPRSIL